MPAQVRGQQPSGGGRWWSRTSEERASRRAYRRSLPPLYRWRRVIVVLLVLGLAVAVVAVVEGNPVDWTKQRYYDLVDETVAVEDVTAMTDPGGAEVPAAVDGEPTTTWETPWQRGAPAVTSCTDAAASLRLEWRDRARVRGLRVSPGLREENNDRLLHPQPTALLVSWPIGADERACISVGLEEGAQTRELDLDTEREIDTLWVAVGAVEEPTNTTVERPVVIRDLEVLRRP